MKKRQFKAVLTGTLVGPLWGGGTGNLEVGRNIADLRKDIAELCRDGNFIHCRLDKSTVITITMAKGKYARTQWVPLTRFKSLKEFIYEPKSTRPTDTRSHLTAA